MPQDRQIEAALKVFGRNIRRQRTAACMTQERLAELANLNIRTVQKVEAGQVNLLITTVVRIARALDCSLDKLGTWDPGDPD